MHVVRLLHKRVGDALPSIHRRRLRSLIAGVEGLLIGQQLWLAGLGRHVGGKTLEKHKIKRIDRLLGNHRLGQERASIYGWLCQLLVGQCRHPCIIVDWSDVDAERTLFILRAAVSVGGRAIPLYEEVHSRYHQRRDTRRFLHRLEALLPSGCVPVIVTDAGFRAPWFKAVEALGWYYVGRVRNREYVRFPETELWFPAKALYQLATSRPKSLGELCIPRATPMRTRAYVYRKRAAGRHRLTVHGVPRRNSASLKHAEREREPWLLISNLPRARHLEKRVVAIYRDRMTIEEAFRDLKAHRHGFAFRHNLGRNTERVANLLLIAALAILCLWLTGLAGYARGLARTLQANTEKQRRVLSVFFVGTRLYHQRLRLTYDELHRALMEMQMRVRERALP